jgi:cold shock CspA family protein
LLETARVFVFLGRFLFRKAREEHISARKKNMQRIQGTIVTSFQRRAISFIQLDDGGELFAHISDYPNRTLLPVGTRVEFEIGEFAGKKKAIKIQPVDAEAV